MTPVIKTQYTVKGKVTKNCKASGNTNAPRNRYGGARNINIRRGLTRLERFDWVAHLRLSIKIVKLKIISDAVWQEQKRDRSKDLEGLLLPLW